MPTRKRAGASARKASRRRAPPRKPASPRRKAAARKPAPMPIRQPPPPRAADPLARQTGARRAYYTAEFLAEAKRRVEQTLESTNAIAHDFGMDHGPLWRLIERYGWVRPEGALRRTRGLSPVMRIAAQADALVNAPAHSRESGNPEPSAQEELGPRFRGDERSESPASLDNATIARLEAAVLKELATVEAMRASLGAEPLRPVDAERTARTLAVLTETLAKLRRLRLAAQPQSGSDHDDDIPDIDELRRDLARRINLFVASRTGGGSAEANRAVALEALPS